MFKYIRESLAGLELVEPDPTDFFSYKKIGRVGFPSRVSCGSHDALLGLYIVGTLEGYVHFFGGGNAHWVTHIRCSDGVNSVPQHIYAVHGKGQALVVCNDSSIYRVSIQGENISVVHVERDSRCKEIRSAALLQGRSGAHPILLLGSSAGNIFRIDTQTLHFDEFIAFEIINKNSDVVRGPIHFLSGSPDGKFVAVAISSSLVLFDSTINEVKLSFSIRDAPICALHWSRGNVLFISFSDGTYKECEVERICETKDLGSSKCEFGPFPAQPIRKIAYARTRKIGDPILIFSDGLPSASFGDRNVVTLKSGDNLLCFDFESPVITFDITSELEEDGMYDSFLLVLTKNELVMIDLRDSRWKVLPTRNIFPLDSHTLTSTFFASDLDEQVWNKLQKLSSSFWSQSEFSKRSHPMRAFKMAPAPIKTTRDDTYKRQLLITGHDDGSIHLWAAGDKCVWLLLSIDTSREFALPRTTNEVVNIMEESGMMSDLDEFSCSDSEGSPGSMVNISKSDDYPPFRKVGVYDPFCDDPRTAIVKLNLDAASGILMAATKCGTVLFFEIHEESRAMVPCPQVLSLLDDPLLKPKLAAGSKPIPQRSDKEVYSPGYQPFVSIEDRSVFIQLDPPTAATSLAILPSKNIFCIGSEYGFSVGDLVTGDVLLTRSFVTGEGVPPISLLDNTWGTFKSMKKSIRHTFRRKKKSSQPNSLDTTLCSDANGKILSGSEDEDSFRPVERKVEARTVVTAEMKPWLVRSVAFLKTPCGSGSAVGHSLWVGTNCGHLLCYSVVEKPKERDSLRLEKELKLSHAAPIIHVSVHVEGNAKPYPHPRLVVVTEEQIRMFSLPSLKTLKFKVKLTSTEGVRIRKSQLVTLHSKSDPSQVETFIIAATNIGEVRLFSTMNPRKKLKYDAINSRDHIALNSLTMSSSGELFYLRGDGSELQRTTVSSHSIRWSHPFEGIEWPPASS